MFVMKRCARCQAAISSSELVMRARDFVFHVHCFTCTVCNSTLTKGDHFGLRDGAIYCRTHYDLGDQSSEITESSSSASSQNLFSHFSTSSFPSPEFSHSHNDNNSSPPIPLPPPGPSPPDSDNVIGGGSHKINFFNGAPTPTTPRQKGRPRKRKPKDLEAMTANLDLNDSYLDFGRGPNTPGSLSSSGRSKRMRTSFKHHQLRTMKSYFSINHNPDAKDLKQLSQKTSLPKRVLQVWFQNARAKWRRMMVKQEGKSDKCSGESGVLSDLDSYATHSGGGNMSLGPHSPPFTLSNSCSSPASLECS
ncbi:Ultrabithorax, putative [Pediculus humanus corporis]|uniref:Ultrabithorax, putative n=1 Tax=Pediculus humanus subsp. corporis TaxID=121224 RepID=E0W1S8_PEDHC|nr:Ultrabithorax, putative [Pediculus humanus corporis]EEB19660.1 Ultrabithorax, putative [Pediculus humanus corporis]